MYVLIWMVQGELGVWFDTRIGFESTSGLSRRLVKTSDSQDTLLNGFILHDRICF